MAKGNSFLSSIDHATQPDIDGPGPGKARGVYKGKTGKRPARKDKQYDPTFDKPDHQTLAVDTAHSAHREVLHQWVRGEATDAKMKRSHRRLHAAIKAQK